MEANSGMSRSELMERYPAVFGDKPKPLKIGVLQDLMEQHKGEISAKTVRKLLRVHTSRREYLKAVAAGGPRYALDGTTAGEVTERERTLAKEMLSGGSRSEMSTDEIYRAHRALVLKTFEKSGLSVAEFALTHGDDANKLAKDLELARQERVTSFTCEREA